MIDADLLVLNFRGQSYRPRALNQQLRLIKLFYSSYRQALNVVE